ncbi:MAG TPA: hypothetical protein VGO01_25595 [Bradyrhizobium sp.]|jgi:hypothetical protein|nr:hypothetical protein [Bradyrhizobium sp.]
MALVVMAGLDPAIHPLRRILTKKMDARVKPAHDEVERDDANGLPNCNAPPA